MYVLVPENRLRAAVTAGVWEAVSVKVWQRDPG